MSTCTFCTQEATHRENTAPHNVFCGSACQKIHYALIAAGGKREREEEEDPQQPIPGFDFTEIVNTDVLINIMQRFTTFEDMFKLTHMNRRLQELCNDPQFQRMYLNDPNGKRMFNNYIFNLHRMPESNIRHLETWIKTARELGERFDIQKLIASAIRHNYLPLVIQEVEGNAPPKESTKQELIDASLRSGRLSIFRFLRSRFPDQEIKLESAVWSGNMEVIRYVFSLDGVNTNVAPDLVALQSNKNIFEIASFLIQKNNFEWTTVLLDRIVQREDSNFVAAFFRNVDPPKACVYSMIMNKSIFNLRIVVVIVQFLGDEIRGSVIAAMIIKSYFSIHDDEHIRWLFKHQNLSKDNKISVFEHMITRQYAESSYISRTLEWMVNDGHVDPSFDENVLYHRNKYLRPFLRNFPQVRAKLLRETLPL